MPETPGPRLLGTGARNWPWHAVIPPARRFIARASHPNGNTNGRCTNSAKVNRGGRSCQILFVFIISCIFYSRPLAFGEASLAQDARGNEWGPRAHSASIDLDDCAWNCTESNHVGISSLGELPIDRFIPSGPLFRAGYDHPQGSELHNYRPPRLV